MNIFELIIYMIISSLLSTSFSLSSLELMDLERSLDRQIDISHALLIETI